MRNYLNECSGFPPIAAMHASFSNFNCHRLFRYGYQRLLLNDACKLSCILEEIDRIDQLLKKNTSQQQQDQWPFDKDSFILRCQQHPDETRHRYPSDPMATSSLEQGIPAIDDLRTRRENLFANFRIIYQGYRETLRWDYDTHHFRQVKRRIHKKNVSKVKELFGQHCPLEGESFSAGPLEYLQAIDDFLYIDADPPHNCAQRILLSASPILKTLRNFLCCGVRDHDKNITEYTVGEYKRLIKGLLVLLISATFLPPVAILYLIPLTKPLSFGVVIVFGVLFTAVLLAFDTSLTYLFAGVAAYLAILVTLLSNSI
ncbi:hypothetical protein F5Y16DRAFT_219423 [Xylariaceae sp. FL0255]|nr:hypothetical protein F5Y16DRAFT_219423 [Xylariaceae sp. FL0255]